MSFLKNTRNRSLFATPSKPQAPQEPKKKWTIFPVIWKAFKRMLMTLGALVFISALITAIAVSRSLETTHINLPDEMVLYLELEDSLYEVAPPANFAEPFAPAKPVLRELVAAIDRAAGDDRVKGIAAQMKTASFQPAHIQELRAALKRFRDTGKFAVIYSHDFGGATGGLGRYYLASAFDEIWMQPLGTLAISGVGAEMPYLRGVLDKLGVRPQFYQREDYKTAYESLTRDDISPENREMTERLFGDIAGDILTAISSDRGMAQEDVKSFIDKGLLVDREALNSGLIDRLAYADEFLRDVKIRVNGNPDDENTVFVSPEVYLNAKAGERGQNIANMSKSGQKPGVALVYVTGAIVSDGLDASMAAAEDIAPAIIDAAQDDTIKAIVIRIDSPGGSPVASETILRAIQLAQGKGKRVVVSMGSVAASGGYWIASMADDIFVSPATITGSIGVLGGKFVLQDAWDKIGVNWADITWGENAGIWSPNKPFNPAQEQRMNAMLDNIYDAFLQRVAAGRGMSVDDVRAIAGGRVWSGKAALQNGLADYEGGLKEALLYTAVQITGAEDAKIGDIALILMPKPKTPIERLMELLGAQVSVNMKLNTLISQFDAYSGQNVMAVEPLRIR